MKNENIFAGKQQLHFNENSVTGDIIKMGDDSFYMISNYDKMNPFLISLASSSNHWLYIASKGGITAGRGNSENALFPYVNDDLLYDNGEITGSKTIIKVTVDKNVFLWEPFSDKYSGCYNISRNIYKNISSTKIIFEEINHDLNLIFKYGWTTSDKYGFVKFSEIENNSDKKQEIEILDGIQNILASGITSQMQLEFSTLVTGYKKNELIEETGIGVFSLSSLPSDRAQPSESLIATTVFTLGIKATKILLSSNQCDYFRKNLEIENETSIKGSKGAYFINSHFSLDKNSLKKWYIVSELNQTVDEVLHLSDTIKQNNFIKKLEDDININQNNLIKLIAQSDGLQLSKNKRQTSRHFSNVLFNIMRGGVFDNSYFINKKDFVSFVKNSNPFVFNAHKHFLDNLIDNIIHSELINKVKFIGDPHFVKLALEYLPLVFSRRHGDPSRPWNKFSIDIKNGNNEKVLNYQGNWRDIFQNWEALALSFPNFLESMIAKFLNNSTADGYNPYRIFRDGFDWEELEHNNPWANIGYWGDHQIIYLLKLLELLKEFNPQKLDEFSDQKIFSFANVPYRIKSYNEIVNNPRDTIVFDYDLNNRLKSEEKLFGSDTKYLKKSDHTLVQVNLVDKLLITMLIKLSNFIPGGGIWMNTQRPEWNDANNALVGYGISMVTLYYIRRYLNFLNEYLSINKNEAFEISSEVKDLFDGIYSALQNINKTSDEKISDSLRKEIADQLGKTASDYRFKIYNYGFSGNQLSLSKKTIFDFIEICSDLLDSTIKENKREDGLYQSYNILQISENEMKVSNLQEMLEGQVAILSSGFLSITESIELLKSLKQSDLYRKDQNSYILYPNKNLPLFIEKNRVNPDLIEKSDLLKILLKSENREIIYKDFQGNYHFQSDIINSEILSYKLYNLESNNDFNIYLQNERKLILDIYEETFDHKTFTGRANTFYKYEGLGSIYWHMVSKLLLAVYETYRRAETEGEIENLEKLKEIYFDIKDGIGVEKTPELYGAFTTDPYSHTPSFVGVQQPGMTGQVKEDIISRFGEFGLTVLSSKIIIKPSLINIDEFTSEDEKFLYYDLNGIPQNIDCEKKSIAFTYCQIPFLYKLSDSNKIIIFTNDKNNIVINGLEINKELSQSVFGREGKIERIEVYLKLSGN